MKFDWTITLGALIQLCLLLSALIVAAWKIILEIREIRQSLLHQGEQLDSHIQNDNTRFDRVDRLLTDGHNRMDRILERMRMSGE